MIILILFMRICVFDISMFLYSLRRGQVSDAVHSDSARLSTRENL